MNENSIICGMNKLFEFKIFAVECIKLCSFENRGMSVKGVLNHSKIQYIYKMKRRRYHLQTNNMVNT